MENKNETIAEMLEKGIVELTIIEGKAPEKFNPSPVLIQGAIDSPARFIDKRKEEIDFKKSHVIVERSTKTIKLVIDEQSTVDKYTIVGEFTIAKDFKKLAINELESYSPEELANRLKFMRSIFPKRAEHAKIVATLRSLKAKINQEIEDADDKRGNVNKIFKQTVESNLPETFTVELPLFEGEEPKKFELAVMLETDSSQGIVCFLESVEAAEQMDELVNIRFDEEIKKIESDLVVIEA